MTPLKSLPIPAEPSPDPSPVPSEPDPGPAAVPAPDPAPTHPEDQTYAGIICSVDPNDKLAPSGYGSAGCLTADGTLAHQIRFENEPSATAPAQRITVTDTLDSKLDLSTFELTEIVFANQVISVPAGLNHYETQLAFTVSNQTLLSDNEAMFLGRSPCSSCLLVEVQASLEASTRVFTLNLTALDSSTGWLPEDPLLGLLYPNDASGRGIGSVSYVVRPKPGLPTGTRIENRARIVFDYNDPIDTPLVFNTLDAAAPTSSVSTLPPSSSSTFLMQWSGTDDATGVASYDIYVSENGNPYVLWLNGTTNTSAMFTGMPGNTYAFYSIAHDNVGNEEAPPTVPDATLTLPKPVELRITGANRDSESKFTLDWEAEPGRTYRVQYKVNLNSGDWVDAGVAIKATGPAASFTDETANATERFYRIEVLPGPRKHVVEGCGVWVFRTRQPERKPTHDTHIANGGACRS